MLQSLKFSFMGTSVPTIFLKILFHESVFLLFNKSLKSDLEIKYLMPAFLKYAIFYLVPRDT